MSTPWTRLFARMVQIKTSAYRAAVRLQDAMLVYYTDVEHKRYTQGEIMDFLHRNANNQPHAPRGDAATFNQPSNDKRGFMHMGHEPSWLRIVFVVLLFSLTILGVALAILMYFGKTNEAKFVSKDNYQAVFLTNGQVYFGKLASVKSEYLDLRDIYYLNTQSEDESDNKNKSLELKKLGCELHRPADQMIINREQVTFWENITQEGDVVKAISKWKQENPNGQKCTTTTNDTTQSTGDATNTTNTNNKETDSTQ